jgi:hypothetical protein
VAAFSTWQVTEADLRAIATCPPIYRDQCFACPGLKSHGTPLVFPPSGTLTVETPNTIVQSPGGQTKGQMET